MGSSAVLERPSLRRTAEAIIAHGFAEMDVDAAILAQHVPAIRNGIRDMTDDASVHEIFAQQIPATDEMGWDQEAGLVRRDDTESKYFFHFHSPYVSWPFDDMDTARRFTPFLESCGALTDKARAIAHSVACELDSISGDSEPHLMRAVRNARSVTRILRYLPLQGERAGNADAYAHIDRSFMTIHWWASEEGLLLFDRTNVGHRVAEKAWDRVAIFPGKKFFGTTQGAYGMSGVHGVRDSRTVRTEDRIAIVTFVHANLSEKAVAFIKANREAFKAAEMRCEL